VFLLLSESGLLQGDYKTSDLYQISLRLGIIGKPDDASPTTEPTQEELKETQELVLRVDGMWCSSCSWLIEKVVGSQPGVVHTRVIYASDTAKVYYKPEQIAPEQITKSIEKLGYATSLRDADTKEHSSERKSLLIKMGVALFLMKNIMFFSYVLYIGYFQELATEMQSLIPYILTGLALPSVFWCGLPIHKKAFRSLLGKAPTMELLFSIGIFAAFLYSIYSVATGHNHYYFDTASSLVALLLVGKYIELSAKHKATENINRLYQMLPKKVRLKAFDGDRLVSIDKLQVGDSFIVKSGEKIPADGEIVSGRAVVDESLLTGESKPIEKNVSDSVVASSMNVNGILEIRATRIGKETVLSNIISLVERALSTKSTLEQTVDKLTRYFIPSILLLSALTFGVLLTQSVGIETALLRAITVLVIACPCALGMATPLAIAAGIGYAAKRGILIRDGSALQQAAKINCVVFDKTGTLTEGKFTLLNFHFNSVSRNDALRSLGSLEQASNHPLANAIMRYCTEQSLTLSDATQVTITDGKGIAGIVEGKRVVIGNEQFVTDAGFTLESSHKEMIEREVDCGRTVVFAGIEDTPQAGWLSLGDSLKASTRETTAQLHKSGLSVHVLSGDAERTTSAIARQAGIEHFKAQALPQDKIEYIKILQTNRETLAMVGDGVNDAPALAQADIGIAMSEGTEIAIASSSITLLRDDLTLIPESIEISRRTVLTVRQNLVWAFLYNTIGIVAVVFGLLNPLMAAGAMLASSLSVVANSMRLREAKGKTFQKVLEILVPWRE
jgi:heavy metal translocating P-type ATPase